MTREEAIKNIKEHCYFANLIPPAKEALDMAIKALEQEPCEDAIRRQAAIVALDDRMSSLENVDMQIAMGFAKGIIHELPPVTPMPKMARWVIEEIDGCKHAICSNCGDDSYLSPEWDALELYKYCPNCGSKNSE